jgi:hypothetical protein
MTNQEIGQQVANTFSEAFQAMARLPDVEKDLAYYKTRSTHHEELIDGYRREIYELNDKIATLEADLAQATKSAAGHKGNVDLMLDEVRKAIGQLAVLTDVVDPKPVEVTPQAATVDNDMLLKADGHSTDEPVIDLPRPPIPVTPVKEWTAPLVVDQSPFVPETSPSGNEPGATAQSGGQSEVDPTLSVTSTQESLAQAPTVPGQESVSSSTASKSPEPRPYWLRPSNMSWADWKLNGGDVPYWVHDDDLNVA